MENYLQTNSGTILEGEFSGFAESQKSQIIKSTMLDGRSSIQVIGSPSRTLKISYCCDRPTRRLLEAIAGLGDNLTVAWDDYIYIGVIDENGIQVDHIDWSGVEECSFAVLVNEETPR